MIDSLDGVEIVDGLEKVILVNDLQKNKKCRFKETSNQTIFLRMGLGRRVGIGRIVDGKISVESGEIQRLNRRLGARFEKKSA